MSFAAATEPSELDHDHGPAGSELSSQEGIPSGPVATEIQVQAPTETRVRTELPDELIAFARAAANEDAGDPKQVGDYLDATREDEVAVTAAFVATDRGYRGWHWSVTLAIVDPARPTISEVVLLPGEQALLAPPWLPWDQRIRAGDVGAGDLLATAPDDIRLVPGYVDSDDPDLKELEYEFGFGRERVLSREGRDEAAQRWHDGPFGPDDIIAQQAPAQCVTCGFYVPLTGLLGMALGACANEYSPADGRVVDAEYGCGAHSATVIDAPLMSASTDTVVDELTLEVHLRPQAEVDPAPVTTAEPEASGADVSFTGDSVPSDSVSSDSVPSDSVSSDSVPPDLIPAEAPADSVLSDSALSDSAPADATWADPAPADTASDDPAPAEENDAVGDVTNPADATGTGEPTADGNLPLDTSGSSVSAGERPTSAAPEDDSAEGMASPDAPDAGGQPMSGS